jgi:tRNA A-37 threonylcarbamoyl transferase component Bud32
MADGLAEGELRTGDRIGDRYTVDSPISQGAMGVVYRARVDGGREVAVKRLIDRRQAARFEIEARLLARLRHPRVVRVIDHLQDDGGQYLVMEFVAGEDLSAVLERSGRPGLPIDEAVAHGRDACEALHYVHEQNIVHRDVKPHNLILGDEGVVLVDFGIARELTQTDAGTRAVGTPLYMAPEVLVGEAVSPRSDVYGLAATIWALLTGRPPAYHDTASLRRLAPGVSAELERTLRQALELRPERRVASVTALAAALGSPLGVSTGESLAVSLPHASTQRGLSEAIVRTAAGVFDAAASSIAVVDDATAELIYHAAWGAGAEEIVGVRLEPGFGIAGAAVATGEGVAVPECRSDPRFASQIAAGTGYVPNTMLVVPLKRDDAVIGALSVLDRRDGGAYGPADLPRAQLFADLAVAAMPPAAQAG